MYAKKSSPENKCAASWAGRVSILSARHAWNASSMPSASFSPLLRASTVSDHGSGDEAKSYCASRTTRTPGAKGADSYSADTTLTTWMDSSCIASSVSYWFTRARSFTTMSSMYRFVAESCCSARLGFVDVASATSTSRASFAASSNGKPREPSAASSRGTREVF